MMLSSCSSYTLWHTEPREAVAVNTSYPYSRGSVEIEAAVATNDKPCQHCCVDVYFNSYKVAFVNQCLHCHHDTTYRSQTNDTFRAVFLKEKV